MRALLALGLLVPLLAGCILGPQSQTLTQAPTAGEGRIDHAAIAHAIGSPIVGDEDAHDHTNGTFHVASQNLQFVAWSTLGVTLGQNGFANFVLHKTSDGKTLAYVAVDGDTQGGFTIADITDPSAIKVLGSYRTAGSGFQEVRVTPDGKTAVLNVQSLPGAGAATNLLGTGLGACNFCIQVLDVSDPAHIRVTAVLPVEVEGTHNMDIASYADGDYLFYVGQYLGTGAPMANNEPVGDRVGIAKFTSTPNGMALVPVGSFQRAALLDPGQSFPHDVLVQQHPDGKRVAYVSHWDGGLATYDVTNPLTPLPLGDNTEQQPSGALAIHWSIQEEKARKDGKTYVWSAPEIQSLKPGTGVVRAYDATDPANLHQVGTWTLPGNNSIEDRFILSPHTVAPDQSTGLAAVAHYHAGVWVLDISDPAHPMALGYYLPHGNDTKPYEGPIWWKKPNFNPGGFLPNVFQVRWDRGLLWVTERGTGLYALRYTGPVPGPVT